MWVERFSGGRTSYDKFVDYTTGFPVHELILVTPDRVNVESFTITYNAGISRWEPIINIALEFDEDRQLRHPVGFTRKQLSSMQDFIHEAEFDLVDLVKQVPSLKGGVMRTYDHLLIEKGLINWSA